VTAGRWARACVDGDRCFVYSPRLGRLYLLSTAESLAGPFQRVLGLRGLARDDGLADPAERILHDRSQLDRCARRSAPRRLRLFYRVLHHTRRILPFAAMARLVAALARARGPAHELRDLAGVAITVHAVERDTGLADCYPRALLTLYLCRRSGRSCQVCIGTLVPTRKMHAWCASEGVLPYEALPEHYLYQPVLSLQFDP
jgi:hypothetical protein